MTGASISMKFRDTRRFERSLRRLKKRYPHITTDLKPVFVSIESNPTLGTVIPNDFSIRKLRVPSNDMQRGKSGGFRLLYKLISGKESEINVVLLFIYAKTNQSDVSTALLEQLNDDIPENE